MTIHNHNVFEPWPIGDKSVQLVATSPPYFGLRKYDIPDVVIGGEEGCRHEWGTIGYVQKRGSVGARANLEGGRTHQTHQGTGHGVGSFCSLCGAWKGQHGLEPSFHLYIEHVRLWAREVHRVLKDDGVFFLNLGDSYGGSWGNYGARKGSQRAVNKEQFDDKGRKEGLPQDLRPPTTNTMPKCKLLIPHRVAIALCDDGWILRNDIVWHKRNGMPESTRDRFSKKFESVFMFVKQGSYYFDLDAVREVYAATTLKRAQRGRNGIGAPEEALPGNPDNTPMPDALSEKGKNPGDVWTINPQPSKEAHYAMWPEALVERMVRCASRPGDTVLDPFCGSGTTLLVAERLNREGVGIDLGYGEIQERRLNPPEGVERELNL